MKKIADPRFVICLDAAGYDVSLVQAQGLGENLRRKSSAFCLPSCSVSITRSRCLGELKIETGKAALNR